MLGVSSWVGDSEHHTPKAVAWVAAARMTGDEKRALPDDMAGSEAAQPTGAKREDMAQIEPYKPANGSPSEKTREWHPLNMRRGEKPNDPKLSDRGVRRGTCVVGGKAAAEAGAVTHVAIRCSAWLGVAVIGMSRERSNESVGEYRSSDKRRRDAAAHRKGSNAGVPRNNLRVLETELVLPTIADKSVGRIRVDAKPRRGPAVAAPTVGAGSELNAGWRYVGEAEHGKKHERERDNVASQLALPSCR